MASKSAIVELDGAHGEGGGVIVRTALSMAALTQQGFRIKNLRGGTAYPGLDIEDLVLAKTLANLCEADVAGLELGSETLLFHPKRTPKPLQEPIDFEPSGRLPNALIVLSTLMPVLARTGAYSSTACIGETYGARSLSFDYFQKVALYACSKMGLGAFPSLERAGFGRESQGKVSLDVEPSGLTGMDWTQRGRLLECGGLIVASELPAMIAGRGVGHLDRLAHNAGIPLKTTTARVSADRPGIYLTLWAQYERGVAGATAIGQKGTRIETLAQQAFESLLEFMASDAAVDPFVTDQLLIPALFSTGPTTFKTSRLTQRFLTAVWVAKQFAPVHITVRGKEDSPGTVSIHEA